MPGRPRFLQPQNLHISPSLPCWVAGKARVEPPPLLCAPPTPVTPGFSPTFRESVVWFKYEKATPPQRCLDFPFSSICHSKSSSLDRKLLPNGSESSSLGFSYHPPVFSKPSVFQQTKQEPLPLSFLHNSEFSPHLLFNFTEVLPFLPCAFIFFLPSISLESLTGGPFPPEGLFLPVYGYPRYLSSHAQTFGILCPCLSFLNSWSKWWHEFSSCTGAGMVRDACQMWAGKTANRASWGAWEEKKEASWGWLTTSVFTWMSNSGDRGVA